MLLSRSSEYAIQSLIYVAKIPDDRLVLAREIADQLDLAYPFLGKILQILVKRNLLLSRKGPKGGFSLALPAEKITLAQIVEAVDGADYFDGCLIGLPGCGIDNPNPCPLHNLWMDARAQINDIFNNRSLSQLVEKVGPRVPLDRRNPLPDSFEIS